MGRIGLLLAAALLVGAAGIHQTYAQSGNAPDQKTDKQKTTEKKKPAKQSGAETTGGQQSAPMSGFRPDPISNY